MNTWISLFAICYAFFALCYICYAWFGYIKIARKPDPIPAPETGTFVRFVREGKTIVAYVDPPDKKMLDEFIQNYCDRHLAQYLSKQAIIERGYVSDKNMH